MADQRRIESFRELEKYGSRAGGPIADAEDGKYVFRASVTTSNGTKRQYTGAVGSTADEAVKQVLDQVVQDRRMKLRSAGPSQLVPARGTPPCESNCLSGRNIVRTSGTLYSWQALTA